MIKNILMAMLVCLPLSGMAADARMDTIDINMADRETLVHELKGIGPAKADAIITYRQENGKFRTVDDLAQVRGISSAFVEANRGRLTVGVAGDEPDSE